HLAATGHLRRLEASLDAAGLRHRRLMLPAGEASKSMAQLESLLDALLEAGVERATTIVAFGGGVIGDLAGFGAAILLRGVPHVQVPTSLLAQVDSAVGGKTGVNARQGKNLIGAFHQPRLVLSDTDVLASLPPRELRAGYAEVVKYGLIDQPEFFTWLEGHASALLAGDPAAQRHAIVTSCAAKAAIVAADEREADRRALLNLGHTFAHAYEALAGYGDVLLHGEAVALGLVQAFALSARLRLCPAGDLARVQAHLAAVGLPTDPRAVRPGGFDTAAMLAAMARDKKVAAGRIRFILARGIGEAFISDEVPAEVLRDVLDNGTD
ncbi:MAG TPA: 3-dehydroquinate synthase, partial [Geminicoccaceae bacterium]|nr:3-dehydroquinate synthase [Geminicoccaceae bacterium]